MVFPWEDVCRGTGAPLGRPWVRAPFALPPRTLSFWAISIFLSYPWGVLGVKGGKGRYRSRASAQRGHTSASGRDWREGTQRQHLGQRTWPSSAQGRTLTLK